MSSSTPSPIIDVSQEDFEREVIDRSRQQPVVVDFWAPWCGPCQTLGPLLDNLARERGGAFRLAKLNIDEAPELAAAYGIEAIPAVKAFRDGRPILEFVGLLSEAQLRDFVDRILPTEADRFVQEARAREAADPQQAEALYRRALDQDRGHGAAAVALARLLLARGQDDEAEELLNRAGPGGDQGAEVERLEAILFLHRLARGFGDERTARERVNSLLDDPQRHYELGCVLAAAGKYPEALQSLLTAAEGDRRLAASHVREAMVKIFQVVGVRNALADEYRDKLSKLLY